MPWCPKCKIEYREGFQTCTDCGGPLTDALPPAAEQEPPSAPVKETFLTTLSDEIEAGIILSKLEAAGIPAVKRYRESGDYLKVYMGNSLFGIDIYVPENAQEDAQAVLSDNSIDESEIKPEDYVKTAEEIKSQDNLPVLFIILGLIAVVVILLALFR